MTTDEGKLIENQELRGTSRAHLARV